jgi:hypothetical protein
MTSMIEKLLQSTSQPLYRLAGVLGLSAKLGPYLQHVALYDAAARAADAAGMACGL